MKVVIAGGGFGGVRAALNLANNPDFEVTLISDKPNFEYHAALYRSATGTSPLEVVVPLQDILSAAKNVEIIEDVAAVIQSDRRVLVGTDGAEYHYDTLILALGNVTEYFGIEGLAEFAYGIKSVNEALRLKRHLHEQLEDPKQLDRHYVVVGGGATGVELAGELVTYLRTIYRKHGLKRKFQVDLVEAAPRLLPILPEDLAKRVHQRLEAMGIKIFLNTAVKGETAEKLKLPDGSIETHTVIWTAGVGGNHFFKANETQFKLGRGGHVEVDDELLASNSVYVIGDGALTKFPGWAQTAVYDADYVTANLKRRQKGQDHLPYTPHQPVGAIPVGPKWCAVSRGKLRLYGYPGWLMRRYLDFQLYRKLMPFGQALSVWWNGTKEQESCPVCAGKA